MPIPVTSDPLALAHAENGRPDQGQQYAGSALKLSQSPSADQRREATSLNTLGLLLQAQGTLTGARPYYERALASWQKRGDHYREGMAFFQLGRLAVELGRVAEGIRLVALCC